VINRIDYIKLHCKPFHSNVYVLDGMYGVKIVILEIYVCTRTLGAEIKEKQPKNGSKMQGLFTVRNGVLVRICVRF
jgi:hypothetical protein